MSKRTKGAKEAAARAQVEAWNRDVPVGTEVIVNRDNGDQMKTTTRAASGVYASGAAMVMVKGISGAYLLDRVRPVRPLTARASGIDLLALGDRANVDVELVRRSDDHLAEIRIDLRVGFNAGQPLVICRAYDLDGEIATAALRAAAAAALEVLAEHES